MKIRQMRAQLGLTALCAALVMGFVACGNGSNTGGSSGSDSAQVLMLSCCSGDDFYYTLEQSTKQAAADVGVDLTIQQVTGEPASQVSAVNAAIAKKPDAILINPFDGEALQAPLKRAVDRGIKVITYDTTINEPQGIVSTFVSADVVEMGRSAARSLLDLIGNRGKVFYQRTAVGITYFDSLHKGWTEIMDAQPGIEQIPEVYSDFEPGRAKSQMETILTAHPDLSGGFAGIGLDQRGIVPAVDRAGKLGKVKLVGVDGSPDNVQYLRDGAVHTVVSVKPVDYGKALIQTAIKAIHGQKLPAQTVIGQCVLTVKNLDDPKNADCLYDEAPAKGDE